MNNPKLVILFVAANPRDTVRLNLEDEFKSIDDVLQTSEFRAAFELHSAWAVSYGDLQELLLRYKPHIVHFSGHGSPVGEIILTNEQGGSQLVQPDALAELFSILKDNVRCVVLNACYTQRQGVAIARSIDFVVGMSRAIKDDAAVDFAAGFYLGLGWGRSVETAFKLGCNRMGLAETGAIHRNLVLVSVKSDQGKEIAAGDDSVIPQLLSLRENPTETQLLEPASPQKKWGFRPITAAILAVVAVIMLAAIWPRFFSSPPKKADIASPNALALAPTATNAPEPATPPTLGVTAMPATAASILVAATTSLPSTPAPASTAGQMTTITAKDDGGQIFLVRPNSLRFQSDPLLYLRSGEAIPFTNIRRIDIGEVRNGVLPLEITFTDGITLAASVDKGADLLQGESTNGTFQKYMEELKWLEMPYEEQATSLSTPHSTPIVQPAIMITTQEGDMAQLIASTLQLQGLNGIVLRTGELIPFTQILGIDVGELKAAIVPLQIKLSNGTTVNGSVQKDIDLLEAETLHGSYKKNLYMVKHVEFPLQQPRP